MNGRWRIALGVLCLAIPVALPLLWMSQAEARLEAETSAASPDSGVAVAAPADVDYCSPELKHILRRVLRSCGLISHDGSRGCQPLAGKSPPCRIRGFRPARRRSCG